MISLDFSNRKLMIILGGGFCLMLVGALAIGFAQRPAGAPPHASVAGTAVIASANRTPTVAPTVTQKICVTSHNIDQFKPLTGIEFCSSDNQVVISHLKTPKPLRGIYMTSWVAGIPSWRNKLIDLADRTEINAVVIDVKDYSGHVSFETGDPFIQKLGVEEHRIRGIRQLLAQCHQHHIYTIARITVFQDPLFAKQYPQLAVQTHAGQIWRDRNGLAYMDPSAKPFWDYIVRLAGACVRAGFDEINFDYVRFPTDGNMRDMVFPLSGVVTSAHTSSSNASGNVTIASHTKAKILHEFYHYLHLQTRNLNVPISADLFGMVLTSRDDLNIGQMLEVALPDFDYICPMIYPSHYPPGFKGYANPALYPYEIVHFVLGIGTLRAEKIGMSRFKIRPWLQDFNLGAHYDATKVIAEKKGTYDAGLDSWLMWDPRNHYTRGAYTDKR